MLLAADHFARRILPDIVAEYLQRFLDVLLPFQRRDQIDRFVAGANPALGHENRCQIADLIFAPARTAIFHVADRHPFAVDPLGNPFARFPVTLTAIVIFRAIFIGIIGKFMIIPHRDHRQDLMDALKVGITAIGGVAQTIVGQLDHFVRRLDHPSRQHLFLRRISSHRIFIKIVAGMDHQIEFPILGRMGIGIEIAEGQIGTTDHTDGEFPGRPFRKGPGTTDRGF